MWKNDNPTLSIFIICLISLLVWVLLGPLYAMAALSLQLLVEISRHIRHLHALSQWLHNPIKRNLPVANGIWGHILANIKSLVDEREVSERQISDALNSAKAAGAVLPDGIFLLNRQHEILWFNAAATKFFQTAEDDLGKKITFVLRQPQFEKLLANTAPTSSKTDTENEIRLRLKKPFGDVLLVVQILPYENDKLLVLARDITDIERIENSRRDFIANVSHELRTPLTVIHGFLETLEETSDNNSLLQQALPLMSEQTVRMTRLIEDLLSLTKVESEGLRNEEDVNIPAMLDTLIRDTRAFPETKHELFISSRCSTWLKGNAEELQSAFGNLLSNAIRYTPPGGTIKVSWEKKGSNAVFSVQDNGTGFDAIHIPRLTERFYRIDKSRSRNTGGTGLGLAIVKHVANRHQAELQIETNPGHGSKFSLRFPNNRCIFSD